MWEQYADNHRGACLLFDADRLKEAFIAAFNDWKLPSWFGDVRYTPAGIAESAMRSIIDDRIFDPDQRADAVAAFIEKNSDDFFFLKSDDFETEHEYRAVLMADENAELGQEDAVVTTKGEYAHVNYGDSLVAVIVGERFPNWQLPGAKARANEQTSCSARSAGFRGARSHFRP
jgi:hypothetical protein